MDSVLQGVFDSILEGSSPGAQENVRKALEAGEEPAIILNQGMIAAMKEVGRRFEEGEYYVPEMLIAARAMQAGLSVLRPYLQQDEIQAAGKIVIGTARGDLHDIGKNLVIMMLEGAGFEVIDLGTNVSPEQFVEAVQEHQPDLVGISALLTTTMPAMEDIIQALDAAGLRPPVKVIVGGAPVTENFARQIGADGYSPDASRAVSLALSLVEKKD